MTRRFAFAAFALPAALALGAAALEDRSLAFPADYRTSFSNYLISDRLGQEDQIMNFWANDIARTAAQAGEPLPDGSVLVAEIYKARKDESGEVIESQLGRRIPGELSVILVMERKSGWEDQYPDDLKVGGWEFEAFSPAGENLNRDTTACRECHQPLADTEYTWSYPHMAGLN
ncbi:MAG: cytochrome P460 family protein [Pikeienuella sp.]|uniref:cytochrome P460 family protein n=1 Tax=Pikeienuella sp. TaxID=2831957 RepID=UPI00391899E6